MSSPIRSGATLIAALLLTATAPAQDRLALVGGMLLDGYDVPPLHHAAVLIEGDRIVAVGRAAELEIPTERRGGGHPRPGDDPGDDGSPRPPRGPRARRVRPLVLLDRRGGGGHRGRHGDLGEAAPARRGDHRGGSRGAARSQSRRARPHRPRRGPRRTAADGRSLDYPPGEFLAGELPDRHQLTGGSLGGGRAARGSGCGRHQGLGRAHPRGLPGGGGHGASARPAGPRPRLRAGRRPERARGGRRCPHSRGLGGERLPTSRTWYRTSSSPDGRW